MLFFYLRDYRSKKNREFFNCDYEILKIAMDKVKYIFDSMHNNFLSLFSPHFPRTSQSAAAAFGVFPSQGGDSVTVMVDG